MNKENTIDPWVLCDLRHYASWGHANKKIWPTYGLLSPGERKLCREKGMVLPRPLRPQQLNQVPNTKIYDMDNWLYRVTSTVDGDPTFIHKREGTWNVFPRPVYIINGVFDVFHGGQYLLAKRAVDLATVNKGYVYALVESDEYVEKYKQKKTIFGEITRAGWFREFGRKMDGVVVWHASQSWKSGFELLNQLMDRESKKRVNFVLPSPRLDFPSHELVTLLRRETQIIQAGFSVIEVEDTYVDVSSSKLRKKFNLAPVQNRQNYLR